MVVFPKVATSYKQLWNQIWNMFFTFPVLQTQNVSTAKGTLQIQAEITFLQKLSRFLWVHGSPTTKSVAMCSQSHTRSSICCTVPPGLWRSTFVCWHIIPFTCEYGNIFTSKRLPSQTGSIPRRRLFDNIHAQTIPRRRTTKSVAMCSQFHISSYQFHTNSSTSICCTFPPGLCCGVRDIWQHIPLLVNIATYSLTSEYGNIFTSKRFPSQTGSIPRKRIFDDIPAQTIPRRRFLHKLFREDAPAQTIPRRHQILFLVVFKCIFRDFTKRTQRI